MSISQPLLRDAGVGVATASIRVSKLQGQITDSRTKLEAIRILANADKAYWNQYRTFRELEVRKQQYDLAIAQLDRAQRRVRLGKRLCASEGRASWTLPEKAPICVRGPLSRRSVRGRRRAMVGEIDARRRFSGA